MVRYDNYSPGAQNNYFINSTYNEDGLRNTVRHEVQHGRNPNDSYELFVVVAVTVSLTSIRGVISAVTVSATQPPI